MAREDKKKKSARSSGMRDRARERAENREQSGGGGTKFNFPDGADVKFFQPKKGVNRLNFIPYEVTVDNHPAGVSKGDLWYQRTIWVHYGIGSEEKKYLCLKTIGKKCPICDARAAMIKDADADDKLIDALKPKERELFQVEDLADEKAGIQLWEYSYHLFGKMLEEEIREGDEEIAGFAELVDGKTVKVRFGEKKMGKNTFLEATRIDFEDRDDYDEDILEDVLDLDKILNILSYDKLEAMFLETDPEEEEKPAKGAKKSKKDEDEEEEEETPRKKRKAKPEPEDDEEEEKPVKRRKTKPEPEDDEEEEEKPKKRKPKPEPEDDEEEEPEEKPAKKKKKPEPEDDEEEDEKPAKKKKKSSDDGVCPEGHEFGTDCDEHDECFDCESWQECKDAQEEASASKKKKK